MLQLRAPVQQLCEVREPLLTERCGFSWYQYVFRVILVHWCCSWQQLCDESEPLLTERCGPWTP